MRLSQKYTWNFIIMVVILAVACLILSNCTQKPAESGSNPSVESTTAGTAADSPSNRPANKNSNSDIPARLLAHFDEKEDFSGTVLVAAGDSVIFDYANGMADKEQNVPINIDTKFNTGSVAKMFTAVAIAQLAEQDKLSFNDSIDKYLDSFPGDIGKKITIEQLLTHTSGLGDLFTPEYMSKMDEVDTVDGFMSFITNQPLRFEPGSRHEYSNAGFVVLGAIIEKISGENYFDYIRNHITEPLGMADTAFYKKIDNVPNLARGYTGGTAGGMAGLPPLPPLPPPDGRLHTVNPQSGPVGGASPGDGPIERDDNFNTLPLIGNPSGGAYSTAGDLLKFSSALRGYKLLSQEYTDLIMTGKVASPIGKYGYGFEDLVENGCRAVGHSGGAPGINAVFRILVDHEYTVIVLSNYDEGARPSYNEILRLMFG